MGNKRRRQDVPNSQTSDTSFNASIAKIVSYVKVKVVGPILQAFQEMRDTRLRKRRKEEAERVKAAESTREYTDPEVLIAEDIVFEPHTTQTEGPTGVHRSFVRESVKDDSASLRDSGGLNAMSYTGEEKKEEINERMNQSSRSSFPGLYVPGIEDPKMDESGTSLNLEDLQDNP